MIDFGAVEIEKLIVHRVGNRNQEIENFLSEETLTVDEDLHETLAQYFFKPFLNATEAYQFKHAVDLEYHPVKGVTEKVLENGDDFVSLSKNLVDHLYDQSNHPHIKTGDVFVVLFNDLLFNERLRRGVGIFKSENKDSFLKLLENQKNLSIDKLEGINIQKLDKGCVIVETDEEIKFQILSVDQNSYDAEYWKDNFLGLDFIEDKHFNTKNYIELCKNFAEDVIKPNATKKDEVDFLNASVKFFDQNETVTKSNFQEQVFTNDVQKESFEEYQKHYEMEKQVSFEDAFEISKPILQKEKRKIKNFIKLDTNIQIKLDFNNPESSQHFIEEGYDEERGMRFYKVYFNKEM